MLRPGFLHANARQMNQTKLTAANQRLYSIMQELMLLADLTGGLAQPAIGQISAEALSVSLAEIAARVASVRGLLGSEQEQPAASSAKGAA